MSLDLETGRRHMEGVNWKGELRTRDGAHIRLYNADGGGDQPVHGAYYTGAEWIPCRWRLSGRYRTDDKSCSLDIVNYEQEAA